jgi:serine/threonine protein phosphatase PrpC
MTESTSAEILVNVFGRTDVGRTREHNEDSFVVADLNSNIASLQPAVRAHKSGPKGTLFMVADGMGGAAAGEIASQMATDIVLRELRDNWLSADRPSPELFARCLKRATQSANQQIHSYATSHQEYRGMGTTATIAGFLDGVLYLCQVGDSRGYLYRNGTVKQITKDQSLMQKLIEAGELTEEEAAQSERRNIILQALGPEATIKVDLTYQPISRGDILLLCSDGLSGQITKDDIKNVLGDEKDLVVACKKLIDIANENGGPDNITVILSRFEGDGLPEGGTDEDVGHKVFSVPEGGATPPMGMDRLTEGPTAPMRPSADRTTIPVDAPKAPPEPLATGPAAVAGSTDAGPVDTEADTADIDTDKVAEYNAQQGGGTGKMILIGAITLIVALGAWFGMKMMNKGGTPDSAAVADSTKAKPDSAASANGTKPDSAPAASGTTTPPAATTP